MPLTDALHWRYATKRMNGQKIPEQQLDRILEAVRLAPASYGLQPYSVLVVKDQVSTPTEKWVCATFVDVYAGSGMTRARSSSKPARPYIWRLIALRRLIWPSVWPLLQGSSRAARTAARSCSSPSA